MVKIYATSCERDGKNFFDVPKKLQDKVREIIEADGYTINEDGTVVLLKEEPQILESEEETLEEETGNAEDTEEVSEPSEDS